MASWCCRAGSIDRWKGKRFGSVALGLCSLSAIADECRAFECASAPDKSLAWPIVSISTPAPAARNADQTLVESVPATTALTPLSRMACSGWGETSASWR